MTEGVNMGSMSVFDQYLEIAKGKATAESSLTFQKFCDAISKILSQPPHEIGVNTPIDEVLAIFLYNMAQFCNSRFFKFLEDTLVCLRSCVN